MTTTQAPPFVYTCTLDCELVIQVKIAVAYQFRANTTKEMHHFGGVRATLVRMKLFPNSSGPSITSLRNRFWNLLDGYRKNGKFLCEPINEAEVKLLTKGLNYAGMVVYLLSQMQRVEEAEQAKPEEVPTIVFAGLPSAPASNQRSNRGSARKAATRGRSYNGRMSGITKARAKRVFQPSRSSYDRTSKIQKTDTAKNASPKSAPNTPEIIHVPKKGMKDNNDNNAGPSDMMQRNAADSSTAALAVLPSVAQMRSVMDDPMCTQSSNADVTSRSKVQSSETSKRSIPKPVDIAPGDAVENVRSASPIVHPQKKQHTMVTRFHPESSPRTHSSEQAAQSPTHSPNEKEAVHMNVESVAQKQKKSTDVTGNGTRAGALDQPQTTRGGTKRKAGQEPPDGVGDGKDQQPRANSTSPAPSVCLAPMQLPAAVREPEQEKRGDEARGQARVRVTSPANRPVVSQSASNSATLSKTIAPPFAAKPPSPVEESEEPMYPSASDLVWRVPPPTQKRKSSPRVPQTTARMTASRSGKRRTVNTPSTQSTQPAKIPPPKKAPPERRPESANVEMRGQKRSRCEAEEPRDTVRQRTHEKRRLESGEERLQIERQSAEKELPLRERSHEHSEKQLEEKRYELAVRVARAEVDARKERLAWEQKLAMERLQMEKERFQMEKKKNELEMEEIRARMRNDRKALELQDQRIQVEQRKAVSEEKGVEVLQRLEVAGLDAIATFARRMLDMRRTSS